MKKDLFNKENIEKTFTSFDKIFNSQIIKKNNYKKVNDINIDKSLDIEFVNSHLDGIMIFNQDEIIYQKYFKNFTSYKKHIWYSATKSITGLLFGKVANDYNIDLNDKVTKYVLEAKGTEWDNCTIKHTLDMTTGIDPFSTSIFDSNNKMLFNILGFGEEKSKIDTYEYINKHIKWTENPGHSFAYATVNTDMISQLIEKITKMPFKDYLEKELWSKINVKDDASIWSDILNIAQSGAGLSSTLYDASVVGRLVLKNDGKIIPSEWIDQLSKVDNLKPYNKTITKKPKSWFNNENYISYKNMWWIISEGEYIAEGANGQGIYINKNKNYGVAFFSHFVESNARGVKEFNDFIKQIRNI